VVVTVDRHANTSAASVPLAFDTAMRDGRIARVTWWCSKPWAAASPGGLPRPRVRAIGGSNVSVIGSGMGMPEMIRNSPFIAGFCCAENRSVTVWSALPVLQNALLYGTGRDFLPG
jgi:hypothetical protein